MATDAIAKTAWWAWTWHPLLFAVFPILTLFNVNIAEVAPGEVMRPLLLMLAAAAAFWGVLALLLRNAHKAALFATLTLLFFFLYGNIRGLLRHSASPLLADCGRDDAFLLRPLLGILLLAFILILRTKHSLRGWTGPLNAAGAFLVIWPLLGIGKTLIPRLFQSHAVPAPAAAAKAIPQEELPNIYYVILDGYAREDTLQRVFSYNNRPFLSHLEQQGFYVAGKSRTNYCTTEVSLVSSLNMNYLDKLISPRYRATIAPRPLIGYNAVVRELRQYGYTIVSIESESGLALQDPDRLISFPEAGAWVVTDFEWLLVSLTPLDALPRPEQNGVTNPYELHRRKIAFQVEQLGEPLHESGPTFVYAHILCPHPPFVLHKKAGEDPDRAYDVKDGSYYQAEGGTLEEYLTGYPAQLNRLNTLLTESVDRILKESRRPTVIILQSDHGSGAYTVWEQPQSSDYRERAANLCAIYTPGGPIPGLYPGITPVNIFRTLFNHYLHTDYPRLPDKTYFCTPGDPLKVNEITAKVK
ncbi:MAG: sulfatase-like hydrolase/transferase [Armatimonadota bacterium]